MPRRSLRQPPAFAFLALVLVLLLNSGCSQLGAGAKAPPTPPPASESTSLVVPSPTPVPRSTSLVAPSPTPRPTPPPKNPRGIPKRAERAEVTSIVDGETIAVRLHGRVTIVTLLGITTDTADGGGTDAQCVETAAAERLAAMLPTGRTVYLEVDRTGRDNQQRLPRYVWFPGKDDGEPKLANEILVREGFAGSERQSPDVKHADRLSAAQDMAKGEGRGPWVECAASQEPIGEPPRAPRPEPTSPPNLPEPTLEPVNPTAPTAALVPVRGEALPPGVAEADIDAFWAAKFASAGISYQPPSVVSIGEPITTGCGLVTPDGPPGLYCSSGMTIYVVDDYYEGTDPSFANLAWVKLMAHEWSHHIQWHPGVVTDSWRRDDQVGVELQADCLAGVYVVDAQARARLDAEDVDMIFQFTLGGDAQHGTREERQAAFMEGYSQGSVGCGISTLGSRTGTGREGRSTGSGAATIQEESIVRVNEPDINLRAVASTEAPIVAILPEGAQLQVTGPSEAAGGLIWWPVAVLTTGQAGYVAQQFLAFETGGG